MICVDLGQVATGGCFQKLTGEKVGQIEDDFNKDWKHNGTVRKQESPFSRSLEPEDVSQTSSVWAEREEYERQMELSNDLNQHLRQLQDQLERDSNYEWDDGWGFGLPMEHAVQSKRSRGYSDSWYMTTTSLSEDIEESPRQRAKKEKESLQQAAEEAHRQKIIQEKVPGTASCVFFPSAICCFPMSLSRPPCGNMWLRKQRSNAVRCGKWLPPFAIEGHGETKDQNKKNECIKVIE